MADEYKNHYDAVIIGSGFGGSVMAYRLAEAGLHVCVLERGKEYAPGDFPRSPNKMKKNFWDPDNKLYGMFDIWSFRDIGAVVSSGLGGGSLIYANVLIRKDEKWFVKEEGGEYWPVNRQQLDPHYDRVEKMLNAQKYPFDHPPYNSTSKTQALQDAAQELELDWYLPNLAVTFANDGKKPIPGEHIQEKQRNLHDRDRYTCRLCGECDIGCNYGSKNTLDYNYLTAAKAQGAELKTLSKVKYFEPNDGGGYKIHYIHFDPEGATSEHIVTANQLILAAGSLGSTYLLLKSQAKGFFPNLSQQIGTHFSGNGDLINFAIEANREIEGSYGPVITSTIRMPDELDGGEGRGFYLQDAGYPGFINWTVDIAQAPGNIKGQLLFILRWLCASIKKTGLVDSNFSEEISQLVFGTKEFNFSTTMLPLLGMGRDIPDGIMKLRQDKKSNYRLDVSQNIKNDLPFFQRLRNTMKAVASKLGAKYLDNPLWFLRRTIAAHPLGGCPMGRNKEEGVVDSYGEVFDYPGFFIADGSVMPGSVGPNPSLTIAALSDRFAERVIENHQKQAN